MTASVVSAEGTPSPNGAAPKVSDPVPDRRAEAGAEPLRRIAMRPASTGLDVGRAATALGAGDAAVGLDPFEIGRTLARLLEPSKLAPELPGLVKELVRVGIGASELAPSPTDRRFSDPTWRENALYRRLGQGYLALDQTADRLVDRHEDWLQQNRARYVANIALGGIAPTNFLPGNPEALKRAFETGGISVLRGARNAVRDVATNRLPRSVDSRAYKVGDNLAATPGAVVYREELFEVLQYGPQTPQVRTTPLLFIPPQLNKYYVLDLAPNRSMVEYAVQHGVQVFMVAWRNPRKDSAEHGRWGLEDYMAATKRAFGVVQDISRSDELNCIALCAGGVTTSLTLGQLAATDDSPVNSLTLLVTMLEGSRPNMVSTLATTRMERLLERDAAKGKVYDRQALVRNFALMRPNDLIFNYVSKGWLQGEDPAAFDVLAWNADASNATAAFERDSIKVVARGLAATPGALTALGAPLDLGTVQCDNLIVAGQRDHITTWRPCYMSSQILGGQSEVIVSTTGHIQTFVNPPGQSRYKYWKGPATGPDPDAWMAATPQREGSWWPEWIDWLLARSGGEKRAPAKLGNKKHPVLGNAPGTYVHEV
jgi:polyhydroxyalkanoate synthase subunit PhaC